jgi:hypothetical protein
MGGVDNLDKDKCIGGSFTGRAMFKKWYRMGLMGIFDFMIVNGRQALNMSTKLPYHGNRYPLTNAYFRIALAEELLRFKDESAVNFLSEARLNQSMIASGHVMTTPQRAGQMGCCVCQLEKQFVLASKKGTGQNDTDHSYYSFWNIVACSKEGCNLHAHSVRGGCDRLIFQMPLFENMSCFEIAHHPETSNLWISNPNFKQKPVGFDTTLKHEKRSYAVSTSHPIHVKLRKEYGLDLKSRQKGPLLTKKKKKKSNNQIIQIIYLVSLPYVVK